MNTELTEAIERPLVQEPLSNDPLAIVDRAIAAGTDPEKLGKLIDLAEKMQAIQARQAYASAIAAFQEECPMVFKGREVKKNDGKVMYTFASYEDIKRVTRPLEAKHRITTSFDFQQTEDGKLRGTCFITVGSHTESRSFLVPIPKGMNTNAAQDFGAAVTYLKRYLYCAALDVVITGEDTDAHYAGQPMSEDDEAELIKLLTEHKAKKVKEGYPLAKWQAWYESWLAWLQIKSLSDLDATGLDKAKKDLKDRLAKLNGGGK